MKKILALVLCLLVAALLFAVMRPLALPASETKMFAPQYDKGSTLVRPKNFEQWTFVGANIGMSYSAGMSSGPGEFHNIYTQPEAYAAYAATGKFLEKTMFLLVMHEPQQNVSINKSGYFEGQMSGVAVSVKDREHFPEGWAYFDFGDNGNLAETAKAMPKPMCFDCHAQHADDDNVFVQFHAILRQARPKTKAH